MTREAGAARHASSATRPRPRGAVRSESDEGKTSISPPRRPSALPAPRWRERASLRVAEVAAITGASATEIRERITSGALRAKRVGRAVYVDPASVAALYGFDAADPEPLPASPEILAFARKILEAG